MPDELRVLIPSRRLSLVAVAFFCALIALGGQAEKTKRDRARGKPAPKAATQPAEPVVEAAPGSLLAERRRLNRIPRPDRSVEQIASLAGVDFMLAIGAADGARAAALIDVVGYQQLPAGDVLLEDPPRPVDPNLLAARVSARAKFPVGDLPAELVEVRSRLGLSEFSAIATWMTAEDRALVVRHSPDAPAGWLTEDACLVVRVRADKATILGGTFFDVLPSTVPPPAPADPAPATPGATAAPHTGSLPPIASPSASSLPPLPRPTSVPTTQPELATPRVTAPVTPQSRVPTSQPVGRGEHVAATQPSAARMPLTTQRAVAPGVRPVPPPKPAEPVDEGPPDEDK